MVAARVGGLQPVGGVPEAGVPGVRKLHAQRAARAQAARPDPVGHGPGAEMAGDTVRRLDPQRIGLHHGGESEKERKEEAHRGLLGNPVFRPGACAAERCRLPGGVGRAGSPRRSPRCIRVAMGPGGPRCSSGTYAPYAPSSRLVGHGRSPARGARSARWRPRRSRCNAGSILRAATPVPAGTRSAAGPSPPAAPAAPSGRRRRPCARPACPCTPAPASARGRPGPGSCPSRWLRR